MLSMKKEGALSVAGSTVVVGRLKLVGTVLQSNQVRNGENLFSIKTHRDAYADIDSVVDEAPELQKSG